MMKRNALINICLLAGSILIALLLVEGALRLAKNTLRINQYEIVTLDILKHEYPAEYHEVLGWIPHPNATAVSKPWNKKVTLLENGIRSNGSQSALDGGRLVLAVGDSFTFGDEVSDDETWPALLEGMAGVRVMNAGVFGYGIDQSFLRATMLAETYKPDAIILSFVPDDVLRNQHDVFVGAGKPYYEVVGEGIEVRNIPVPKRTWGLDLFRKLFSKSYLVHEIMMRINPTYWLLGSGERHSVSKDGLKIACLLLDELDRFSLNKCIPVIVLSQYSRNLLPFELKVRNYINQWINGKQLYLIDLWEELARIRANEPERFEALYSKGGVHMSKAGNQLVANAIMGLYQPDRIESHFYQNNPGCREQKRR
jgi:hypothetical protein